MAKLQLGVFTLKCASYPLSSTGCRSPPLPPKLCKRPRTARKEFLLLKTSFSRPQHGKKSSTPAHTFAPQLASFMTTVVTLRSSLFLPVRLTNTDTSINKPNQTEIKIQKNRRSSRLFTNIPQPNSSPLQPPHKTDPTYPKAPT